MASQQDDAVFAEEDQEQDLEEDEESSSTDDLEENDDIDEEEENDNDEEDLNSASAITVAFPSSSASIASVSAAAVTVAVPPSGDEPDPKRNRVQEEKKPPPPQPPPLDESRRLFQRLWTDEDEIELLQGFLEYTSQRGNAHHHDTALFYDQIKSKLQLDFNKNQLVEKLRRLKKKYRNVLTKIDSGKDFSFKTAHDQATFEISSKIWCNTTNNTTTTTTTTNNTNNNTSHNVSVLDDEDANHNNFNNHHHHHVSFSNEAKINSHNHHFNSVGMVVGHQNVNNYEEKVTPTSRSRKRSRSKAVAASENVVLMNNSENHVNLNANVGNNGIVGAVEETVRSCLSPLVKELLGNMGGRGIGGLAMNAVMPLGYGGMGGLGFGVGGFGGGEVVDEKWRKQQILELEVYSKRLELVQDQIKVALEELRNMGG